MVSSLFAIKDESPVRRSSLIRNINRIIDNMVECIEEKPNIQKKKSLLKSQKSYKISTKYNHPKMKKNRSKTKNLSSVISGASSGRRMKRMGTKSLLAEKNNNFFQSNKKHGYLIDKINKSWFISGQGN